MPLAEGFFEALTPQSLQVSFYAIGTEIRNYKTKKLFKSKGKKEKALCI